MPSKVRYILRPWVGLGLALMVLAWASGSWMGIVVGAVLYIEVIKI